MLNPVYISRTHKPLTYSFLSSDIEKFLIKTCITCTILNLVLYAKVFALFGYDFCKKLEADFGNGFNATNKGFDNFLKLPI